MNYKYLCLFFFLSISYGYANLDQTKIQGNNTAGPYRIDIYDIDTASLCALKGIDTLIFGIHYRFLANENAIILNESLPDSSSLLIYYRKKSDFLPKLFFHRDFSAIPIADTLSPDTVVSVTTSSSQNETPSDQFLQVGGLKTFGVSATSSGGVTLNQSLQVQLQGQISENVQMKASLSDQNLPLQPEGTTRTLSEIEQVRIDVDGKRFGATLGEFYDTENLPFLQYSKKIQGIAGRLKTENLNGYLTAANSRGTFRTFSFKGQDGRQGPYRLIDNNGENNIVILAGTEEIWVDGKKMVRGSQHDYTIDYSLGTITFNPQRPITFASEITANYEYLEQLYERTFIHGWSSWSNPLLKVRISGLQQNDSRDHPLDFSLSDDEKKILENAGSDPGRARTTSLRPIDQIEASVDGFYLSIDSASTSFYRYYPPDSLDSYKNNILYAPNFSYAVNGDYIETNILSQNTINKIYRYVGKGLGNFTSGRILAMPQSRRLVDLAFNGSLQKWNANGEMAVSDVDLNTFSDQGDLNNLGLAGNISTGFGVKTEKGFYSLLDLGHIDSTFKTFGTINTDYNYRKRWDLLLNNSLSPSREDRAEIITGWKWNPETRIQAEAGILQKNKAEKHRFAGELNSKLFNIGNLLVRDEDIRTNFSLMNSWLHRDRFATSFSELPLGPFGGFETEWSGQDSVKTAAGIGYQDVKFGLDPRAWGALDTRIEAGYRHDRISSSSNFFSGDDSINTLRLGLNMELQPVHGFSFQSVTTQQRVTYLLQDSRFAVYDLADISLGYEPKSGFINLRNDYKLSSAEISTEHDLYRFVGEGKGSFEKDTITGDYKPREGGGWDFWGSSRDSGSMGRDIQLQTWIKLKPSAYKKTNGVLDDIYTITRVECSTKRPQNLSSAWMRYLPAWAFNAADSLNVSEQKISWVQDIYFQPNQNPLKLDFRFNPSRSENFYLGHETEEEMLYRFHGERTFIDKIDAEFELDWELQNRNRFSVSFLHYEIDNRGGQTEISYHFSRPYILSLLGGGGKSVEAISSADYNYYFVSPSATRNFSNLGRIRLEYRFQDVLGSGTLYYKMAQGYAKGITHRWTLSSDYKLGDNLMLNLYYLGRLEESSTTPFHQANVDLRAYF